MAEVRVRAHMRRRPGAWFFKTVRVREHTRSRPGSKKKLTWTRLLLWLLLLYLLYRLWTDPRGSSQDVGPFLSDVGHFFMRVVGTFAVFLSGLAGALQS